MTIFHIKRSEVSLQAIPDDEHHSGDAVSAYATLFASRDGAVEVGLWDFQGDQRAAEQDGYEEVVICLEGSVEIECDGRIYALEAGDVIVYDCPIGSKQIRSPLGFKAAYVVRHRDTGLAG